MTKASSSRRVAVILGAGRSGTSLLMQTLVRMGMRVSDNLVVENISNPMGFFEDADIVKIHKSMLSELSVSATFPLKKDWQKERVVKSSFDSLKTILDHQACAESGVWGFKDPRTATFLPVWIKLFNQLKIVPRFLLAVRKPQSAIKSFLQQYGMDQAAAEMIVWLRTLDALAHTGGDCYIVEYESWFKTPGKLMSDLERYVFGEEGGRASVEVNVFKNLNRSESSGVTVRHRLLLDLYDALYSNLCGEISRSELMMVVSGQLDLLQGFSPWLNYTYTQSTSHRSMQSELTSAREKISSLSEVNANLERMAKERDELKAALDNCNFLDSLR